tara:strand:+ start:184 stop:429 length:246 start_codon:yes stop_codon:yes gene_type:complete
MTNDRHSGHGNHQHSRDNFYIASVVDFTNRGKTVRKYVLQAKNISDAISKMVKYMQNEHEPEDGVAVSACSIGVEECEYVK